MSSMGRVMEKLVLPTLVSFRTLRSEDFLFAMGLRNSTSNMCWYIVTCCYVRYNINTKIPFPNCRRPARVPSIRLGRGRTGYFTYSSSLNETCEVRTSLSG